MIISLSRYGGLRCPSEHILLKWADINWDEGKMLVTSPKTERYPDGASRQVPVFAELLLACF